MNTRLFVRLHREACVPGARCAWILRDARGSELRRGESVLAALPAADAVVGVLAQDLVLVRAVGLPPGRKARTPAALASAIEPHLLSDPASNHVVVLREARDGTTVLAAMARSWLDTCLASLGQAHRSPAKLVLESSLVPRVPECWVAICRPDGGFLCLPDEQAITLDTAADGAVPEGLRWHLQSTPPAARPPRLRVHHGPQAIDAAAWEAALGVAVERAAAWDWADATATGAGFDPAQTVDLLAALRRERSAAEPRLPYWRTPLLLAALVLVVHVGATLTHYGLRAAERSRLRADIDAEFRKSAGPNEPLVDAVLQTQRTLASARRAAGQYAPADFMPLLARLAAETAHLPPAALRSVQYGAGTLTATWSGVPAAALEKSAQQLRSHGLRVDVAGTPAQTQMVIRAHP